MTTYRCAACSSDLETKKVEEWNVVEVKPCEACLEAAEEASFERGKERGYEDGYNYREAIEEAKEKSNEGHST